MGRVLGLCASVLTLSLAACGGSNLPSTASGGGASSGPGSPTVPVSASRAGKVYSTSIVTPIGDTIWFTVFEPTQLVAGQSYPLVFTSEGYGGTRETAPDAFIQKLENNGYYVIYFDERGFGQSSGQVRVMDPDYEGQDLVALLDWAESLPGLRRHADGSMVVGSYGGSYGGMFQFLMMGADPKHRLHVLAPDITPHDLIYALDENSVVKSGWGLVLVAGGEAGAFEGDPSTALQEELTRIAAGEPTRQDPTIYEALIDAGLDNAFTTTGVNYFKYHSVDYFCNGQPPGPQSFLLPIAVPDTFKVPPTPFPKADVLLSQGMPDTLFNYNNGYANYQCMKALGGDVRLLSHQSGHILPVSLSSVPLPPGSNLQQALDPFYAAINPPEFQGPSGASACGSITVENANFAWFQEKLQGIAGAADAVITTGQDFCMSLADGDAIELPQIKEGGQSFTVNSSLPQLNSLLGVVGSLLGTDLRELLLSAQPIYTAPAGGAILAGIPTMNLNVTPVAEPAQSSCPTPLSLADCDPMYFLAIGKRGAGEQNFEFIDAQLTPMRGFGAHSGDMNAISARLKPGDQLALLIYAFHAQYPITWSRDLLVPAATVSGTIQLPLLSPSDIVRQGV